MQMRSQLASIYSDNLKSINLHLLQSNRASEVIVFDSVLLSPDIYFPIIFHSFINN
jgi:hypothetical protein